MAYAAYGWVALPWWTWPLIFVVVMAGVYAGMLLDRLHDRRTDRSPVPCLAHMGEHGGMPVWCLKRDGHDSPHWGIDSARFATMTKLNG